VKYLVKIYSDSLFYAYTAVGLLLYPLAGCSVEGILIVTVNGSRSLWYKIDSETVE
jgi:hypothetical protein